MNTELKKQVQEVITPNLFDFNKILTASPKSSWIREHKNVKYIPIRIVEDLLRSIFGAYQVELQGEPKLLGNSVVVSCQLKVYHPILKEWLTYAGVGAVPIQLQKDSNPLDFDKIIATALHKNVPAALSFAIQNASKKIGRIFGASLNNEEPYQLLDVFGTENPNS